jgi:hypothetical protein
MKRIYFAGGSWAAAIYIGICKGLEEQYGTEYYKQFYFSGDSVGAFVALLCSLGYSSEQLEKIYTNLADLARKNGVSGGKMSEYHELMLNDIMVEDDIYKKLENNNFSFGVSNYWHKHKIYKSWKNNEHIKKTLHASFHIPFYCKYQGSLDDCFAYDGGFSMNNDILSQYDITIGKSKCYDLSYDISLYDIIYPPSREAIKKHIAYGYVLSKNFDFDNVDKKKRQCIKYDISLYILKFLVLLEIVLNEYVYPFMNTMLMFIKNIPKNINIFLKYFLKI